MNPSDELCQLQNTLTRIRQHIRENPGDDDALSDLAVFLAQAGQAPEAITMLEDRIRQGVSHPVIRHNLAELYRNTGNLSKADALFDGLIAEYPRFIPAYKSLIPLLAARLAQEAASGRINQDIAFRLAALNNNLGNALMENGDLEDSESAYREAIRFQKDYPSALSNLSNVLTMMGRLSEAEACARRALAIQPDFAQAWNNLGTALSDQIHPEEAEICFRRALDADPSLEEARHNATSGSLMMQLYQSDLSPEEIVLSHRRWGALFPKPEKSAPVHRTGKIRIGFISSDFREHSVIFFVEPLMEKLDRSRFEIFCYANQNIEDDFTRRIKALDLVWKNIFSLSDDDLCGQLRADGLHLLIDLCGHTRGGRLEALARKPVRVMAHFIGYPATTGLAAIDYRLSDRFADPECFAAAQNTEQVIYLEPSQFNYRPRADAPAVNSLPAQKNGRVTFGSLNIIRKLNRRVIEAWSRILHGVSGSRLLLHHKFMVDPGVVGRFRGMFEAFGIAPNRLDFRPADARHLETYHEIDIALDPFPYNGAATTCEALWMGVPVVTLAGDRSSGRMGVSLLHAAGLEAWIAGSVEAYVRLAITQSKARDELARLRKNLRPHLRQSPLCNETAFVAAFANAIEKMVDGG